MMFLSSLKWYALLIVVGLLGGWLWGLHEHHMGVTEQEAKQKVEVSIITPQAQLISQQVVTQYQPQLIEITQFRDRVITKEVTKYVTQADDRRAVINNGFVQLWNATNTMQLPSTSSGDYGEPSPVVLSDIAAEHAREAAACTAVERQRDVLKSWITQQQSLYNNNK